MHGRLIEKLTQFQPDWRSKLTDGILAALVLVLVWLTIALAVRPIEQRFGAAGLLIYALGLLAVSMFALQQSLVMRHAETTRAWYGTAGGFLAWAVIVVVGRLGVPVLPSLAGVVLLIMVTLIVGLLWRSILPLGVRFFCMTLLLNWAELIFMSVQGWLAQFSPVFTLTFRATGYLAAIGVPLVIGWILLSSQRRLQRLSGALAVWFLISLVLYVFQGALF